MLHIHSVTLQEMYWTRRLTLELTDDDDCGKEERGGGDDCCLKSHGWIQNNAQLCKYNKNDL